MGVGVLLDSVLDPYNIIFAKSEILAISPSRGKHVKKSGGASRAGGSGSTAKGVNDLTCFV